jgi:hypothetical protein
MLANACGRAATSLPQTGAGADKRYWKRMVELL